MLARSFGYDFETDSWIEYTSHSMIHDEIEAIPYRIWALGYYDWEPQIYWEVACISDMTHALFCVEQYFSDERCLKNLTPQYIYCPWHDAIEKIAGNEKDYTVTEAGCRIEGIPVWSSFVAPPDKETQPDAYRLTAQTAETDLPGDTADASFFTDEIAPVRWRIFRSSPMEPLTLIGDVAVFSPQRGREWKKLSLTVSPRTRETRASRCRIRTDPDTIWEGAWTDALNAWDGMGGEIDIPPIVADAVLEALREGTFLVEGIRPSVLSGITGKAKIMAFIRRPFDLNVVFLKDFLCMSDTEFDSIFPYEEKNIYQRICRYLNIRPPKSLRRAYTFNPYAIVWFMLFLQWGVRDINFMHPFFLLDVRIGPAYIHQFRYDRSTGRVESTDAENWDMNCEWEAFDRYCQFLKRTKGERAMMRWLYRYSSRDYLSREQQDTIEAVFEYGQFFPEDVMERLRKDGLTGQVHCLVSQAVAYISMQEDPDFELPCDPLCLEAECDVNEYRFRLIHNIGDLIDAGIELQNCVASYQRRIMNGQSSIFVVRKSDKWIACIELNRARQIVQALGPKNKRLVDDSLEVCRLWAKFYQFPIATSDLAKGA